MEKKDLMQHEYYYVQSVNSDELVYTAQLLDFIDDEICIMSNDNLMRKVPIKLIVKRVMRRIL